MFQWFSEYRPVWMIALGIVTVLVLIASLNFCEWSPGELQQFRRPS